MKFDLIYADPAWNFVPYSHHGTKRSAEAHYNTAPVSDMEKFPVQHIAADNAVLLMWSTYVHLPQALRLGAAWGFEYKTVAFTWAKLNKKADTFFMGLGYYTRANPEICLLFTRGKPLKRHDRKVRNLVVERIRKHSQKPDSMYGYIERLFGDVRRVELFAREKRDGWRSLGNEIDGLDLKDSIAALAKE